MTAELLHERSAELALRLTMLSRKHHQTVYDRIVWPESLADDEYWSDPALLSVAGTAAAAELSELELIRLSRAECRNFFSLNVHGIRRLMIAVIDLMHTRRWHPPVTDFLHQFVGEENEHMWFFAEFCHRYAGGVYPELRLNERNDWTGEAADLLAFVRILVFEEVTDHWNKLNARCDLLPPFVRELNRIHREDEGRHVAFGEAIVRQLAHEVSAASDGATRAALDEAVRKYVARLFLGYLNHYMYADAGLPEPVRLRRRLAADPACHAHFLAQLGRCTSILREAGILTDEPLTIGAV